MKKSFFVIFSVVLLNMHLAHAGIIYQNFEPDNGASINVWSVGTSSVGIADRSETVHLGRNAIRVTSAFFWSGFGVQSQVSSGDIDLKQTNNDRLIFWTYAMPHINCYVYGCDNGTDNNVGVTFYDNANYQSTGFEVWTTQTAHYEQWSKLKILFSQLPPDFNLQHVTKIEFKNYNPGKYFFDDIHAVREDRVYQSFEIQDRSGSTDSEYGWKWNDTDVAGISGLGEPVYEGSHSWRIATAGKWAGTGIQSQDKKFVNNAGVIDQSFWNVDLNPANNDRLTFWVYGLHENEMDNNLGVQFYDNGAHATDDTKVVAWPKKAGTYGKWTRMSVLFSELKKMAVDLNLSDINKIQFQNYWAGTMYIDDIRATGSLPDIKEASLAKGLVQWDAMNGAVNYRLQESLAGPDGPWSTIYSGPLTSFDYKRISKSWLRVRWEEGFTDMNTIPYASGWSDVAAFLPPAAALKFSSLQNGKLEWPIIPQASGYEIQSAPSRSGPWTQIYKGLMPLTLLGANQGTWYRVRALIETGGVAVDTGAWSAAQSYVPGSGFVKASGMVIKDANGAGNELVLKGVNLGGSLLIEPWMTGLGQGDNPSIADDFSIREALILRFGDTAAKSLLQTYQNAYLNAVDFDRLFDEGVTLARLPFYYRNLQDENGNWILKANGQIDFTAIDRIVDALSDRGVYVVLDLHGAPGYQNADANSGHANVNKLFAADGQIYRDRTVSLWTEVAKHYKDNPWVLGYDLLNEPIGAAPSTANLANLYDSLYRAIRAVDANHMIIMEGIWFTDPNDPEPDPNKKRQVVDWDTLPIPSSKGWSNVLYQFHFYNWNADENFASHKAFVDQKVAAAALKQPLYNVPVMIGEFYGFGLRYVWDYYVQNFNARKWSWTTWTYKYHDSPGNWGIVNHANYDEDLPNIQSDYYQDIARKFLKYTTADYHVPNVTLQGILFPGTNFVSPVVLPPAVTPLFSLIGGGMFTHSGNFGDTPGVYYFYPAPCSDIPPGTHPCNNGDAAISYWSKNLIKGYVPPDAADLGSRYSIISGDGAELYPTMMRLNNHAPVLNAISNQAVNVGQAVTVDLSASDSDGDALGYTVYPLPEGAVMSGRTFSWTPDYRQAKAWNLTFKASDGQLDSQKSVVVTVNLQAPDLTVTALSTSTTQVVAGNLLTKFVTVQNLQSILSSGFQVGYHLSKDAVFGGSDDIVFPGVAAFGSLNGSSAASASVSSKVPVSTIPGSYYLCAQVDSKNIIIEKNEANNTFCSSTKIDVQPLVIGYIDGIANQNVLSGWACTYGVNSPISVQVYRNGLPGAGGVLIGQYLADAPAELGTVCGTPTQPAHRFRIILNQNLSAFIGQALYVIPTPAGSAALPNSGKYVIPSSVIYPTIYGNVDGLTNLNFFGGWACEYGVSTPIKVQIYRNGLPGAGGVLIGEYSADQAAEAGIGAACGTPTQNAHRFKVLLSPTLVPFIGQALYVVPSSGGAALSNSGRFVIPASVGSPTVLGYVDGVVTQGSQKFLAGWACNYGVGAPIAVTAYRNGPPGTGVALGSYTANLSAEAGVGAACGTPSQPAHRFKILLDPFVASYSGQYLYVTPSGGSASSVLINSGKYVIPN